MTEYEARRIFDAAIREGRCAELLNVLFDGGSATVDDDDHLVMLPADLLGQLAEKGPF